MLEHAPFARPLIKVNPYWQDDKPEEVKNYHDDYFPLKEVEGKGLCLSPDGSYVIRAKRSYQDLQKYTDAKYEWRSLQELGIACPQYALVIGNRDTQVDKQLYLITERLKGIVLPDVIEITRRTPERIAKAIITAEVIFLYYFLEKLRNLSPFIDDLSARQVLLTDETNTLMLIDLDLRIIDVSKNYLVSKLAVRMQEKLSNFQNLFTRLPHFHDTYAAELKKMKTIAHHTHQLVPDLLFRGMADIKQFFEIQT